MSPSDSATARLPSPRNKLLVWAGIACAVIVLVVVTFLSVTSRNAARIIKELRAHGEPVCVADIQFDESISPSDLNERITKLLLMRMRSVSLNVDSDKCDVWLTEHETWPEARAVMPAIRAFVECVKAESSAPSPTNATVNGAQPGSTPDRSRERPMPLDPHEFRQLVRDCEDPHKLDHLTDCERLGVEALGLLKEPCVPAALDVCAVSRETGERMARQWTPSKCRMNNDEFGVLLASATIHHSIPRLLLAGDVTSAISRIESMLHAADSVRAMPWVDAHWTWIHIVDNALDSCRLVLASRAESVDWSGILRSLDAIDPRADLERALLGERAFGIEVFQAARSGRFDSKCQLAEICPNPYQMELLGSVDFGLYLDVMGEGIELSSKSAWTPTRGSRNWQHGDSDFPQWARLSWSMLPNLDEVRWFTMALETDVALAKIAIQASMQGAKVGEEMAASTQDPFDGGPLRSRVHEHVLELWSVGMNLVDDDASSEEILDDRLRVHHHAFWGGWSTSGTVFERDIVWRVRVR